MVLPIDAFAQQNFVDSCTAYDCEYEGQVFPTLKKVVKLYKIRREGSFVNGFK